MILFKVYPEYVPHFVETVKVYQPRIALTGWFYTERKEGIHWDGLLEQIGYGNK